MCFYRADNGICFGAISIFLNSDLSANFNYVVGTILFDYLDIRQDSVQLSDSPFHKRLLVSGCIAFGIGIDASIAIGKGLTQAGRDILTPNRAEVIEFLLKFVISFLSKVGGYHYIPYMLIRYQVRRTYS